MSFLAGVDIGGTKCAVSIGQLDGQGRITLVHKVRFPTPSTAKETINVITDNLNWFMTQTPSPIRSIGISCGGPLDSQSGTILCPPNLPNWHNVEIVSALHETFQLPVGLENDANACALAEWQWGAGQGCKHMVFLTFGTGMGAGLILNGALYRGASDMAGEVGHIRMEQSGPVGYGKEGSFEGYCSGGGIAQLALQMAQTWQQKRGASLLHSHLASGVATLTAQIVGEAAEQGDALALAILQIVGTQLGRGIALLMDVLNPERIVIGSIYVRQQHILEPHVQAQIERESLFCTRSVCKVVPAKLGEDVGDYAALGVAWNRFKEYEPSSKHDF